MTSIYGPKQCSVSNVEYSELANITVKITYMEEKESTGWRGVRRRQRLDEYELQIISELYYVYPDTLPFDVASASIMQLSENGMIIKAPYMTPTDMLSNNGKMNWNYTLQPFMKKALDNNPKFLKKKRKRQ